MNIHLTTTRDTSKWYRDSEMTAKGFFEDSPKQINKLVSPVRYWKVILDSNNQLFTRFVQVVLKKFQNLFIRKFKNMATNINACDSAEIDD